MAEDLTSKGVEFTKKDIMIDDEARKELINLGVRSTRTLVVDGKVVTGFDKVRINALLNL
ncbi:MAG: glutaredoxin family protein [Desulfobacterales bacterium]